MAYTVRIMTGPAFTPYTGPKVFVFGSNEAGIHGAGAARWAVQHYGAIYGQGEGLQGNSYAIPTKNSSLHTLDISEISRYVDRFIAFADAHQDMEFYLTPIGCGLAGYDPTEIAPLFDLCAVNVEMPESFGSMMHKHNGLWVWSRP